MRILDKYILKELFGPFFWGVGAFSSIFIGTGTLFRIAQYITQYGASVTEVLKLFIYSLPGIVVVTFPMSMLLAALLAFGRLSSTSEITAMKSGGISFYRLAAPVIAAAFLVSIFAVAFHEFLVPAANAAYNYTVYYEIQKNERPKSQEYIVIKDISQGDIRRLTFARRYDETTGSMYGVTIQEFENDNLTRVENAERAVWQQDRWIMYNGVVHDLTTGGSVARTMHFDEQVMPLDKKPANISLEQKKPEEMTIKELKQQIKALRREYMNTSDYEVELQQRLSIPMASMVFALIGTPLGLSPHRSSSSIGFGLSIIVIFIYYSIMTFTTALGQGGAIPAVWAAWIPNIIALIAGGLLVRRAAR
ncbi:permease lptg/lptf-related [Lucifera butyrica]|uniref:Permease lptg/lptf-related n=1 Tax=Lucifera butyrica TaxID=1351585 RepID=A0A498RE61_9FIRM|nr:LptF/LptG family permease [Lucifera butyrica]VBB09285.1 permease lptg/lptf-related [Lucifera butyrica]